VKQPVVRRRFSASKKLEILAKVARLRSEGNGQMGAYLRSEGLYYATVQKWQTQAEAGKLGASKGCSKAEKSRDSLAKHNKALRRKLEQMEKKLAKQEMIIDLQKKLSDMLQMEEELNACEKRR
jgi:transposase-like protein